MNLFGIPVPIIPWVLVSPGFRDIGPEEAAELCRGVERAITTTAAEVSYLVLRVRNVSSK